MGWDACLHEDPRTLIRKRWGTQGLLQAESAGPAGEGGGSAGRGEGGAAPREEGGAAKRPRKQTDTFLQVPNPPLPARELCPEEAVPLAAKTCFGPGNGRHAQYGAPKLSEHRAWRQRGGHLPMTDFGLCQGVHLGFLIVGNNDFQ